MELNKQWREVLSRNFEKSFDHRSFHFRTQDRRLTASRQLVNEIKELAPQSLQTAAALSQSTIPPTRLDQETLAPSSLNSTVVAQTNPLSSVIVMIVDVVSHLTGLQHIDIRSSRNAGNSVIIP
jgi:hypothetical protein